MKVGSLGAMSPTFLCLERDLGLGRHALISSRGSAILRSLAKLLGKRNFEKQRTFAFYVGGKRRGLDFQTKNTGASATSVRRIVVASDSFALALRIYVQLSLMIPLQYEKYSVLSARLLVNRVFPHSSFFMI